MKQEILYSFNYKGKDNEELLLDLFTNKDLEFNKKVILNNDYNYDYYLILSSKVGNLDIMKYLINNGADIHIDDD